MAERRMAIIRCLLCLCLCFCMLTGQGLAASKVWAAESVSPQNPCTITLIYAHDGAAVSGASVKLYRIADMTAGYRYVLTSVFSASGLQLNGIASAGEWDVISSTLESYILSKGISADYTAFADQNGVVSFQNLTQGLYLAQGGRTAQGGLIYTFESALISVPGRGDDGGLQYQVTAVPKSQVSLPPGPDDPPPEEEVEYKILKLWKGDAEKNERPASIEVELFCDGELCETVVVSEKNQWSFTLKAKEGSIWTAAERNIPEGYTVTVGERENTIILTNTLIPKDPIEDPSDENPENPDDITDVPSGDTPGDSADSTDEGTFDPKTGDTSNVLLYIIMMYVSGSILILLGIAGKRKKYED
ncbi:MAG: Cna B-type domain-containing protein [Firmicutes bacterium]|nr:Cna B-type domain-containing protein [Bacillota bacterium]